MEHEADPRHAEIIIKHLGLETDKKSSTVVTPGIKETDKTAEKGDETLLIGREATGYRAAVARCIYLSQDRTDIQYATKELSRKMSNPCVGDIKILKRLGRHLKGRGEGPCAPTSSSSSSSKQARSRLC